MTEFGTLNPDGTLTNVRTIQQSDMRKCPHFIMMADHYRTDGSCRCDDPEHTDMSEWEYEWNGKAWI